MSSDEVMAIILHLAQNMKEELPGTNLPAVVGTLPHFFAFVAAAVVPMVDVTTPVVAAAVVVVFPTCAMLVVVWTTCCRHARPRITPGWSGLS
jgi:hypothetical protein